MMILHYVMYIDGCSGEKLKIKPKISNHADKLYNCIFFNPPIIYNSKGLRDTHTTDGGRGGAKHGTVIITSSPLGVALFEKLYQGQTIKDIFIYKLTAEPNKPQGDLIPMSTYHFVGVSMCAVGHYGAEKKMVLDGEDTNTLFMAQFDFDTLYIKYTAISADGKFQTSNKAISNVFGRALSGAK